MPHERDDLEARIPEGKVYLRHDSNNPEHLNLSCDDRDECTGDNGGEDKIQITKYI